MANNKHDQFEKNDYSTNNVLSNKGAMNIPFGSIFCKAITCFQNAQLCQKNLVKFQVTPKTIDNILSWEFTFQVLN